MDAANSMSNTTTPPEVSISRKLDSGITTDMDSEGKPLSGACETLTTEIAVACNENATIDDELEEGELKDDDDDDDEDEDDLGSNLKNSKQQSTDQNSEESASVRSTKSNSSGSSKRSKSSKVSRKSELKSSSSSSNGSKSSSSKSDDSSSSSSSRSSGSSSDSSDSSNINNQSNDGSSSRQSFVKSQPSKSRRLSPNQHAKLVSMRARLLEARSREIELKFQKNRSTIASSPSISVISSSGSVLSRLGNLKKTAAKPIITYAENPNPTSVEPYSPKVKKPKKRKKKSSSSSTTKKKKSSAASHSSKKSSSATAKLEPQVELPNDIDRQGPRTPPDNQILSLEDEQIEWPSYLIKMTVTQPSISYSVNPASVLEPTPPASGNETADLNSDYYWYYNYLLGMDLSKAQAHHQACSVVLSSGDYDEQKLDRFLEQRGFIRQSTSPIPDNEGIDKSKNVTQSLQLRSVEPVVTTLRLNREIVLPNGKVLPRGTIQKIVHPFPRTDRVVPEIRTPFFDL